MNHLDLFSGIGGFSLAARWTWGKDHNVIAFVEQDKYCQKVLNKHWNDVPIINDIRNYTHERTQTVDLLTGGFPCQPFSVAGKRRGNEDDRFLWHEMLRIIKESTPTWIIGENVTNIVNMELDNCIIELEDEGYEVEAFIIPASAVEAHHRRDRVWIIAHTKNDRCEYTVYAKGKENFGRGVMAQIPIKGIFGFDKKGFYEEVCAAEFVRKANGIPGRVDRLRGLGNAIVPQVAYEIMRCIAAL
jgi:DNA (cytosine-5)-methyltransferase 1